MYGGTAEKEQTRDTYHGYVFPEVERLISAASAEIDPATRQALLDQAQDAVWDTWPCLWAFVPNAVLARQARVRDIDLKPTNSFDLSATGLVV
jgi:peptide/nickel transport system substrate-binding protein